jgi:hypothetical protein
MIVEKGTALLVKVRAVGEKFSSAAQCTARQSTTYACETYGYGTRSLLSWVKNAIYHVRYWRQNYSFLYGVVRGIQR